MLITILIIFGLVALLGIYLISYIFQGKETPKGLVFIHGPLAALGIILLILYASLYQNKLYISVAAFILAAMGGLIMITRDIMQKSVPIWLATLHGLVAIFGFIFLLWMAFG